MKLRAAAAAAAVVVVVAGLALFEPWTLWTRSSLVEAAPDEVPPASAPATPGEEEAAPSAGAKPVELARGKFVKQEHPTRGTARVVELADGRRVLRVEGFSTTNGPDLEMWLSEATAGGNWFKYDERRFVSLGKLKATDGDHNYRIPKGADLDGIRSAVVWCVRFDVAFGSAPLDL